MNQKGNVSLYIALIVGVIVLVIGSGIGIRYFTQKPPEESKETESHISNTSPEIVVKPIFFIPNSIPQNDYFKYTEEDKKNLLKSLKIAQNRYKEMLGGTSTFSFDNNVEIYKSIHSHEYFVAGMKTAPDTFHRIIDELLKADSLNRCNSKYVYLIIYWRTDDTGYQPEGGRTLNGGPQTGGGGVYLDFYDLKSNPWFLSTLLHGLGHSFGLLHCDAHDEDMKTGKSIMCYTPSHHSLDKFTLPSDPGVLTEEDKFLLSLNQKVFAGYTFKPTRKLMNVTSANPAKPPYLWPMDNPIMSGVHANKYYQVCNGTSLIQ